MAKSPKYQLYTQVDTEGGDVYMKGNVRTNRTGVYAVLRKEVTDKTQQGFSSAKRQQPFVTPKRAGIMYRSGYS
jgi:hypothetical protein